MRILLDECVDQRLHLQLAGHDCQTAAYAGFAGFKNGALLSAAEEARFDVLITTDQEIPFQQDLSTRTIAILVLCAQTNRLAALRHLIPDVLRALDGIQPGQVMLIS
ncbi:MAG: hypothetical protein IPM24_15465 [Bryobacterales bacterium]|nr:hypothetical protein [Bryobacterales bacterium]